MTTRTRIVKLSGAVCTAYAMLGLFPAFGAQLQCTFHEMDGYNGMTKTLSVPEKSGVEVSPPHPGKPEGFKITWTVSEGNFVRKARWYDKEMEDFVTLTHDISRNIGKLLKTLRYDEKHDLDIEMAGTCVPYKNKARNIIF